MGLFVLLVLALSCADSEPRGSRNRKREAAETNESPRSGNRTANFNVDPSERLRPAEEVSKPSQPQDIQTLSGKVVGVSDGDTIVVYDTSSGERTKVRLATIDCPEKSQAFGVRAKQSLSDMVFGKNVEVEVRSIDRYGRTVGVVKVGGTDVNLEQIKRGFAWHYKQYAKEQPSQEYDSYDEAERGARERRVGLWLDVDPVPPWNFRRAKRNGGSTAE